MKFKSPEFVRPFIKVLDILFSFCVIGPVIVLYWVTTWKIFDIFIFPDDLVISSAISFAIGFLGQFIFIFFQATIAKVLKSMKNKFIKFVILKIYALLFAQTNISLWRGVWNFVDMVSSDNTTLVAMNAMQNIIIMMISKTFRNSISIPFIVETDRIDDDFVIPTYFKQKNADRSCAFFFDCICSVSITFVSAFVWRDIWDLTDDLLLPEDILPSALISIAIGGTLAILSFSLENSCAKLCERFSENRIYIHDAFFLICLMSTVQTWRGLWKVMEHYIGDRKEIIFLLNGICWKVLIALNVINSIAGRGVFIDAAEKGADCIKLPIDYFGKLMKNKTNDCDVVENAVSISTKL